MILYQYPPQSIQVSSGPIAIEVDGVPTNVSIDTVTPANTVPMPVSIYSSSGPINITAGDINVQLSDQGVNYDITRIGDGTNQWGFNASSEGLVRDTQANAELDAQTALLTTMDADTSALAGTVATEGGAQPATGIIVGGHNGSGTFRHIRVSNSGVVQVEGPLTDAELRASAVPVSMASAPLPTGAATETTLAAVLADTATIDSNIASLAAEDFATETTLSSINTKTPALVGGRVPVDGSGVTQPVSAASLPLPTGAATEATLSAMSAKLPAALGQTNMAGSMSVTIASDQSAVPVTFGSPSAVTVKQAQITVGTSAVRLTTDGLAPSSTRIRLDFRPSAASTARFFYGSSGVTTSNGLEIFPGESVQILNDINDYYIISNTAGQTVGVVEAE